MRPDRFGKMPDESPRCATNRGRLRGKFIPLRGIPANCRPIVVVCILLCCATAGRRQTDRSALSGTATGPGGACIPGVVVTASEIATELTRKTVTSSTGTWVIDGLPIGRYIVVFSRNGFSELRVEGVDQAVGETRVLNASLRIDALVSQTTVTEPLVRLDKSSAAIGSPVEPAELRLSR